MTELAIRETSTTRPLRTGIAQTLLFEIAEHLAKFAQTGEEHQIDLKSLPMTPGDLEELTERLGMGEVRAEIAVIGSSEVYETAYSGVWRIRHFGSGDKPVADEIVIASAPGIIFAHVDDAREAAVRLLRHAGEKWHGVEEKSDV